MDAEVAELMDAENRLRTKYMKRRFKLEEASCILPSEDRSPFHSAQDQDYYDGHLCIGAVTERLDKQNAQHMRLAQRELKLEEAKSAIPYA